MGARLVLRYASDDSVRTALTNASIAGFSRTFRENLTAEKARRNRSCSGTLRTPGRRTGMTGIPLSTASCNAARNSTACQRPRLLTTQIATAREASSPLDISSAKALPASICSESSQGFSPTVRSCSASNLICRLFRLLWARNTSNGCFSFIRFSFGSNPLPPVPLPIAFPTSCVPLVHYFDGM